MRFLIGIITGTALTLFIATTVDAPTQTTLNKATDTIARVWQSLIATTSDSLFAPSGKTPDRKARAPDLLASAGTPASPETPDASPPRRAAEPATALVPPAELPPPPPVRVSVPVPAPVPAPVQTPVGAETPKADRLDTEAEPFPALAAAEDGWGAPAEGIEGRIDDEAGVWAPFHSQMSARGFAARLSQALDHDFRVERRGAGAYEVVFDAATPAERDALLSEIAEFTGQ